MISLPSILFLLLFQSLTGILSNCNHYVCLRIQACANSGDGNAPNGYFRMLSDPTEKGCADVDYVTIVFDQRSPHDWDLTVNTNVSSDSVRASALNFHLSFGETLIVKKDGIVLVFNASNLGKSLNSYSEVDSNSIWTQTRNIQSDKELVDLIDWSSPRLNITAGKGGIERQWCKNYKEDEEYCEAIILFNRKQRNRFIARLNNETEEIYSFAEMLNSVHDGNCSLEEIEDVCKNDCQPIKIIDGKLKCDSKLWLKTQSDEWLKVDGGYCGSNNTIELHRDNRIVNNSTEYSRPIVQCSPNAPTCHIDIDLPIIILSVYSVFMTIVIGILYIVLYRALDKCVGPKREGAPSSYSYEVETDTLSHKDVYMLRKETSSSNSDKQEEKTTLIPSTMIDGQYENLTIH